MEQAALAVRLRIAITQLIVDDWRLLATGERDRVGTANEVAVAFALGWRLKPLLDRRWDVDCEYNRATDSSGSADVKRRSDSRRVYPDLLVHRRRERGRSNNLLVLELKTNSELQKHRGGSYESVADVVAKHHYQHGVFVDLAIDGNSLAPRWAWHRPKSDRTEAAWLSRRPIYSPQALEAIVTRATLEAEGRYQDLQLDGARD